MISSKRGTSEKPKNHTIYPENNRCGNSTQFLPYSLIGLEKRIKRKKKTWLSIYFPLLGRVPREIDPSTTHSIPIHVFLLSRFQDYLPTPPTRGCAANSSIRWRERTV